MACETAEKEVNLVMKKQLFLLISAALLAPLSGVAAYATTSNSVPPLIMRGAVVQPKPKTADQVSPAVAEVLKLSKSKVGDDVITSYIENSPSTYNLTSENIIYLHETGLKSQVITAMIKHDKVMYDQLAAESARAATNRPPNMDRTEPDQMQPYEQGPPELPPQTQNYYDNGLGAAGYFYGDLAPYGSWFNMPGYGWCWQPALISSCPGWAPYCDGGNWSYGNAGWNWNSEYPWGWAAFHYGRWWNNPDRGWCWFPGRTWGPSWVTWRTCGDICGWAPLPPSFTFSHRLGDWQDFAPFNRADHRSSLRAEDFTFINFRDFGARNLPPVQLSQAEAGNLLGRSTVVNNFAAGPRNTFVNRGIDVTKIAAVSAEPIRQTNLRNVTTFAGARQGASKGTSRITVTAPARVPFTPIAGGAVGTSPQANNAGGSGVSHGGFGRR